VEDQIKDERLNVMIESDLLKKVDIVAKDITRTRSQIARMILRKYFDLVDQGKIEPIK